MFPQIVGLDQGLMLQEVNVVIKTECGSIGQSGCFLKPS